MVIALSKGSRSQTALRGFAGSELGFGTSAIRVPAMARVFETTAIPHSEPGRNTAADGSIVVHTS